ncbi:hypothetical protein RDWZM_008658 [Blomia tropicalis]|uniref:Serine/threonine-protein phosphatase n=1 Tax=Blomia tropicalis TaxID=40697 RepID=A0A9Q0M1R1_BLOTA|nr:hypothetical protein RDWZM_008658 [Blomia tropicalis]
MSKFKSVSSSNRSRSVQSLSKKISDITGEPAFERLRPEGNLHTTSSKTDCVAFIIHCTAHDRILISRQEKAIWIPFTHLPPNRSWKECALLGFCLVISGSSEKFDQLKDNPPCKRFTSMQVLRVQLPQTRKFLTRLIYYIELKPNTNKFQCCQPITPRLEWWPLKTIQDGEIDQLWGPELVVYCNLISPRIPNRISEYSLEEAFHFVPRDPPRNLEEDMLKSLHITEKVVERLYAEFLEHCFPSMNLTYNSFKVYMSNHQFENNESRQLGLFRAFNYNSNGYLTFHEFLMGLACMEPNVQHGEYRARFIFRYYDVDRSDSLSESELRRLIVDLCPTSDAVEQRFKEAMETMCTDGRREVKLADFINALGTLRFRGTSVLCRSTKSIFAQISQLMALKSMHQTGSSKQLLSTVLNKHNNQGVCPTCVQKKYNLASHMMTFDINGNSIGKPLFPIRKTDDNNRSAPQYSLECVFNPKSPANLVLQLIRQFNSVKRAGYRPLGLMQDQKEMLWSLLTVLHTEIDALLDAEEKCQRIYSPCYVMGDIHGNLEDLLSLEKALWKVLPCVGSNYLFLGDYVDRGHWGFECALYLIAFKILCPNKVTLLRGNHEVRTLQTHYTYQRECRSKYGEEFGLKLWELTNRIFDKLPVCALIDDTIFAAHGGIPRSTRDIEQIVKVKRELRDPEHESSIAWEILWSDPCHMQTFFEAADLTNQNANLLNGFVRNIKRGTAYLFNEDGANNFLRHSGLTHIIRAHEVPPAGFAFHFGNKCVTIFSCSHYCGNDNESACILIDNQRLRVIQLDTVNNASATDY